MPRPILFLLLLLLVLGGAAWFLAGSVEEVPTKTVEVDVAADAAAR